MAQEGMHSIKTNHLKGAVIKIDLSKAYDRVNWLYIRLLLTHLGFHIDFIRWIMCCITSVSFAVLINGAASPFFHVEWGLRQGCPLSPLLFLLVVEGLSHFLKQACEEGDFKGIEISKTLTVTHLLFVDDILIFSDGSRRSMGALNRGLDLFRVPTGMVINEDKSTISWANLPEESIQLLRELFRFPNRNLDEGVKYLVFHLKPNSYRKIEWAWLLSKIEKRIGAWSHKWLSRAGRLVLVKAVLEAMPIYWMPLIWIPKGILEKIRKLCFSFLWRGSQAKKTMPWVRWERLALPKALGGWGLKNIFNFSKDLATKVWNKYIAPMYLLDWIRNPGRRGRCSYSCIWKAIMASINVICTRLAWMVGNGQYFRIGLDPWPSSHPNHSLSRELWEALAN